MPDKVLGYALLVAAVLLHILGAAAFYAMLRALTVTTTLAAIESAIGSLVICVLLLVGGRKAWDEGRKRSGKSPGSTTGERS
jgi:membrane protein implicated in regulation of membrane protease activity